MFRSFCNSYANIAKGESRAKRKRSFQVSAKPSRPLYSLNIAKGESRAKRKRSFQVSAKPSRPLYSLNIAKGESGAKRKRSFQVSAKPSRLYATNIVKFPIKIHSVRVIIMLIETIPPKPVGNDYISQIMAVGRLRSPMELHDFHFSKSYDYILCYYTINV